MQFVAENFVKIVQSCHAEFTTQVTSLYVDDAAPISKSKSLTTILSLSLDLIPFQKNSPKIFATFFSYSISSKKEKIERDDEIESGLKRSGKTTTTTTTTNTATT